MYHILCFCKEKIGPPVKLFEKFVHYNERAKTQWDPGTRVGPSAKGIGCQQFGSFEERPPRRMKNHLPSPSLEGVGVGYFRITFDYF
jgi:hypothetical protein